MAALLAWSFPFGKTRIRHKAWMFGAGKEIRTLDPRLGKAMLYR